MLPQDTPTEQQLLEKKETLRKTTKKETHNDPENKVSELQNFLKPTAGTIDYRKGHFEDNANVRLEHNKYQALRNLRAEFGTEPYDKTEFNQDYRKTKPALKADKML